VNPYDIAKVMAKRRSTRAFAPAPVAENDLRDLVWAGVQAPSGCNTQNQRFRIVTNKDVLKEWGLIRRGFIAGAPAAIAVFARRDILKPPAGEGPLWDFLNAQNCAAAIQNMALLATAKGLANCWLSLDPGMERTRVLHGVGLDAMFSGIDLRLFSAHGLLLVGYPSKVDDEGYPTGDEKHAHRPVARRDIEEYVI